MSTIDGLLQLRLLPLLVRNAVLASMVWRAVRLWIRGLGHTTMPA